MFKVCKSCGKEYDTHFLKSEHCSKKCYGNTFSKKGRVPAYFSDKMIGYTKDEIKLAYNAFLSWEPLLSKVECKCEKNGMMCYPHYLEQLSRLYNPLHQYYSKY